MRLLKILALTMVVALLVAGVASAKVRGGMAAVADTAEDVLTAVTDPTPAATPTEDASATPSPESSDEPTPESSEEPPEATVLDDEGDYANHGAAVSEVARNKSAVETWTNPAGKEITNHGQAVRLVAHSDAGKKGADSGDGDATASGSAGNGNGKKDK